LTITEKRKKDYIRKGGVQFLEKEEGGRKKEDGGESTRKKNLNRKLPRPSSKKNGGRP